MGWWYGDPFWKKAANKLQSWSFRQLGRFGIAGDWLRYDCDKMVVSYGKRIGGNIGCVPYK